MGNDIRHKGLLLDEADFALPRDCDMETLTEAVNKFLVAEFSNEFDHPSLEIFGLVSEGLDQTTACRGDSEEAIWVKPDQGFQDIFLAIAAELDLPEPQAIIALRTARTHDIETHFEDRIKKHIDLREYHDAQLLIEHLSGVRLSGIPGVKGADDFDTRGEDLIVDYRVNNYGPGRRVLAEIAFNWGQ